jgi:hypothetical protein
MRSAVNRVELADRLLRDVECTEAVGPIITSRYTGSLHHLCGRDPEHGPLSRRDYAKLATTLLIEGAQAVTAKPTKPGQRIQLHTRTFDALDAKASVRIKT